MSSLQASPARLSHDGLAAVTSRLARSAELWRPHVAFDPERRYYRRLTETDDWEAWLLTWLPGQGTGVHDHGDSAGAFTVVQGSLLERSWPEDVVGPVSHQLRPGHVRAFDSSLVHEVVNTDVVPAVSLHVYAPRLTSMRSYDGQRRAVGERRRGRDG